MKPAELVALLEDFYQHKLAMRARHEAAARLVGPYEVNNTYQYIIAREDVQLSWVRAALQQLKGTGSGIPQPSDPENPAEVSERLQHILQEDVRQAQAFVDRWRDRVELLTHARHQGMLRVILGETLEHKRFFEQALAGRRDLLGRHVDGAGTVGEVLPTRWVE